MYEAMTSKEKTKWTPPLHYLLPLLLFDRKNDPPQRFSCFDNVFIHNGKQIPLFYELGRCECNHYCQHFCLAHVVVLCYCVNLLLKKTDVASTNPTQPSIVVFRASTTTFPLLLVWCNRAANVPHSPQSLSLPPLLLQEVQNFLLKLSLLHVFYFLFSIMLLRGGLIFGGNKRKKQDIAKDFLL